MAMEIQDNLESKREMGRVKQALNEIYQEKSRKKVSKMKKLEIDNQVYDIQKLQREKRYENDKKIDEIRIGNIEYKGSVRVVQAIEKEMEKELKTRDIRSRNMPASEEEEVFLGYIPQHIWSDAEIRSLSKPITVEIWEIFWGNGDKKQEEKIKIGRAHV